MKAGTRIRVLKMVDAAVGTVLIKLMTKRKSATSELSEIRRILLIRPGGIGDAVLLIPVVRALTDRFPTAQIDILCEKRNAAVFGLTDFRGTVYLYDRGIDLFRCIRNKYDAVIDTEQWHRLSAVVAALIRTSVRIGFATNERERIFSHKIPYHQDDYELDSFFKLMEPFSIYKDRHLIQPPIRLRDSLLREASEKFRINNRSLYVAIAPGASISERCWGGDKYARVASALSEGGYEAILLGTSADRIDALKIKESVNGAADLTGFTSLAEAAAILSQCRLLICSDSGLLHIAAGVGIPTLSLFGPGRQNKWAPAGKTDISINLDLPCSPCTSFGYTPPCPHNTACMKQISAEEVIEAAFKLLKNSD